MITNRIPAKRKKILNQVITVEIDGIKTEMTRQEFMTYLDDRMRSYTLEELQQLNQKGCGHNVKPDGVESFWSEGLDTREKSQAENISPENNVRIAVNILDPYTQQGNSYTYKLENFPKKFGVQVKTVWAAYLANYTFYTMGKFLFIQKDKSTYHIGNLIKPVKKVTPKKKKVSTASKKFFK